MSRSLSAAPPPLAAQFAPAGAVPNNNNNNPYTQFLIRSLTRNDQELAAVQELHVRLHALRQDLERRHPKLLLKHLGRGKIRLTTATLPTSAANDDRDGLTTSSAPPPRSSSNTFVVDRLAGTTESSIRLVEELQQEQQDHHNNRNDADDAGRPTELPLYDVAVSFLLHMKLRRRLLNRLARRLLRVAHALDTGKLPETPALPTYGDLRLHIDPHALRAFGQLRLEQERCLASIQQQKEQQAATTEAELSNPLITSSSGVKEEDGSGGGVKEEDDDIVMAAEALLSSEAATEAAGDTADKKMEEDADDEDGKADDDEADKKDDKKALNGDGESKADSKKKKKKSSSKKKKEEEEDKKKQQKKTPEEEEAEKRLEEQRQRERQEILRTSLPRLEYQPFLEYKEAYEKHVAIEVKKEEEEEEPSPQEDDDEEDKEEKDEDDEEEDEEDEAPQKKALRRMPHPSPALPRYTRLSSFSSSNNKQPESEGGESSSQPQQQQRKEDYERIPLGSMGIGAHPSSRLVHTAAERLAEFQAYKAGLYAKVPNQPRLYAQPRVFCYKQRLAKLKEQERAEKKRKEEEARQKIKQAVAPSARGGKTLRRNSEAKSPGGKTLKRSFDEGDDEKSKKEETVVSPSKAPGMGKTLVKRDSADDDKEAAAVTSDKGNDSADDEKSTPEDTQETQDDTDEEKAESAEEAEVAAEEDEDTPMADVSETADAEEHSTGKGKDDEEEDEKMQTSDDDNEKSDDGEDAEHEKMTGEEGEEPSQDKTVGSDADSQKEEGEDEDQNASAAEDEEDTGKKTAKAEEGDDSGSEDNSGTAEKTNADPDRKEKASDRDTIAASDDSDDDDDYEDPVKNLKRPISLVPTPSFFDQDLKRIKLIHDELISTSMHNHARHRMEEVTRDYNAALRASNACFERRQSFQTQLQEMVQENRSYIGQMNSDYQVKLAVARNNWNARRQAFESQKLEHLMPQRHNPQHFPEGTAMTHLYIRQPDASRQIIAQYVGGMVDAISQIEQGTKTNQPFLEEFRPPPKPDAGLSHKKRMEDQIRQEIANLTQQLRVCEDERHKAWRRMMKTKAEFDVPHQHQRQRVAVNMNNYSALPMPPLRQSSSQNIPHEVARPSAAASFASYAPQQSRRPPPMAAAAGPDENPSKYAKYTAARVRQRIADDGTVAPVTAPKRTKDGLYQRPAGRTRKGKEWDAIRGLWVPSRSVNQE